MRSKIFILCLHRYSVVQGAQACIFGALQAVLEDGHGVIEEE